MAWLIVLPSVLIVVLLVCARTMVRPDPFGHHAPAGWVYCGNCGVRLGYAGLDPTPEQVFAVGADHRCERLAA